MEACHIFEDNLEEILDIIDSIPQTMCGRNESKFLYELSKKSKGLGAILEIGTHAGRSTIAMAYAQKEKNGRPIHTIDIREHPDLQSNLDRAGVSEYVNKYIGRSSTVAKNWNEAIELLFIDGDHRYSGIVSDIKHWSDKVAVGGLMIFHDYPKVGGRVVNQTAIAIRRKVLSKPYNWRVKYDREAGNIFVCERLNIGVEKFNSKTKMRQIIRDVKVNIRWQFEELEHRWIERRD
jgi:predicted O-methyltransferase YrrM